MRCGKKAGEVQDRRAFGVQEPDCNLMGLEADACEPGQRGYITEGGSCNSDSSRSEMSSDPSAGSMPVLQGEGEVKSVSTRSDGSELIEPGDLRPRTRFMSLGSDSLDEDDADSS